MTARNAFKVLRRSPCIYDRGVGDWTEPYSGEVDRILFALAAAPADGPLTAEVECSACKGGGMVPHRPGGWIGCVACGATGTVRLVMLTEDVLRERLNARAFHEAYERLAPEFGYETRRESAVPWEDVPENNRRLMEATVDTIVTAIIGGD